MISEIRVARRSRLPPPPPPPVEPRVRVRANSRRFPGRRRASAPAPAPLPVPLPVPVPAPAPVPYDCSPDQPGVPRMSAPWATEAGTSAWSATQVAATPSEKAFETTPEGEDPKISWSLSSDPTSDGTAARPHDTRWYASPLGRFRSGPPRD